MSSRDELQAAEGVIRVPLSIVNAYLVGPSRAGDRGWVLVDAGLSFSSGAIVAAAANAFGAKSRPAAIVLTHGHFDHVGSLEALAEAWDTPVYAHQLEMPYLTGRADYPPPDPAVGGGAMAWLSPLYSRRGLNLGNRVRPLPDGGVVPCMPGWRWIHTPGHTPGHVSLFRDTDRVLIAGDAFVTTKQESFFAALFKPEVVHGPPAYFTSDWDAARSSVRTVAQLSPDVAATGHGVPMRGNRLRRELNRLAQNFDRIALPADGRYVRRPAVADNNGVLFVPPAVFPPAAVLLAVGAGFATGALSRPTQS